ncbi:hypothetical protein GW17_00042946 [Ensete ventricosum]|nr:hypothetical protein GW17_00042946 [Ensete ventricosum]
MKILWRLTLMTIDFDGDINLAEKEVVLSIAVKILTTVDFDGDGSLAEKEQMILLEQWPRSPAEHRRGAVVAAATTRAATRAVSGVAGEEGELSAEKVVTMAGVGEEESGDNNKGCSKEGKLLARRLKDRAVGVALFSYRKKIMVGVGAVDSDVEWRRLRWQRRTQGRKRPLRLGRSAAVADDRSRCNIDDWQPLGYGRGGYVGSSGDRGDNKMSVTRSNVQRRWLWRRRWLWASDGGAAGEGPDDAGRSVSISLVSSTEEAEDRCGWEWLQTSDGSSRFWRGRGALIRTLA